MCRSSEAQVAVSPRAPPSGQLGLYPTGGIAIAGTLQFVSGDDCLAPCAWASVADVAGEGRSIGSPRWVVRWV